MKTPKTLQSRYVAGLQALGYQELTTTRYVGCKAFRHSNQPTLIVFVGKGGSVRVGQNRTFAHVPSPKFKQQILEAFENYFDADDFTVNQLRGMRRTATGNRLQTIETALALRDHGKLANA